MANKKRIWELDAFRGLCILGVIIVHTIYDLQMFGMMTTDTPTFFNIIRDYGSLLFKIKISDKNERIKVGIPGRFSVYNALLAIAITKKLLKVNLLCLN